MPVRIQRKRTKGWKMPPNTVSVTRPGKWGNPFVVGKDGDAAECVALYRHEMKVRIKAPIFGESTREGLASLRGKNLACFCPLDQPCHADVLLELANGDA